MVTKKSGTKNGYMYVLSVRRVHLSRDCSKSVLNMPSVCFMMNVWRDLTTARCCVIKDHWKIILKVLFEESRRYNGKLKSN